MEQYLNVARYVLEHGRRKESRTGVDTLSTFNYNYEIDLRKGFPLLTTKEISWKNIVIENLWFLSGSTNIELLRQHDCKFWEPWADEGGYVPSAYGNFWRSFPAPNGTSVQTIDQVAWVLDQIKNDPMSRRHVVSAWAPSNAHDSQLPPCHALWIINVQMDDENNPYLCLHLTQRSADVALGVPYNIAGYAFILELFAHLTGIQAGVFAHTLIDAHIYTSKPDGSLAEYDHVPGLKEQLTRTPRELPKLKIDSSIKSLDDIDEILDSDIDEILDTFHLSGYNPHQAIKFNVAV